MAWQAILKGKKPALNSPVLVEGLPGIGNVGKIAVDFLVDELKAVKLYELFSYHMPHSVFVNEKNLVELPSLEIYYKKGKQDLLFLVGDVQPIDEASSYAFCDMVLDLLKDYGGKEVIALGGIGLKNIPAKPKIYCTANTAKIVKKYKKGVEINDKIYGVVGPIIGVSGLLLGLGKKKNIDAIALLAETYGHPMYLGIKGAREIVKVLNRKLELKVNIKSLDKEIKEIEQELKKAEDMSKMHLQGPLKRIRFKDTNYIG